MNERKIALIVDDSEINRETLKGLLSDNYVFLEAKNGLEALSLINKYVNQISVAFLDIIMPEMDGLEVLENINLTGCTKRFPVFIITTDSSEDIEANCLSMGAFDFIRKPFNAQIIKYKVTNAVSLFDYKNTLEDKIKEQTKKILDQYSQLQIDAEIIQRRSDRLVEFLADLVEARDFNSGNHVRNVCNIVRDIATELNRLYPEYQFTEKYINTLGQISMLHDIGKISIPDIILLKAGKLTDEEYDEMKNHTIYGEQILNSSKSIWDDNDMVELGKCIARWHHERWDGHGYPDELIGENIPIAAQIVSVADCYEALTADRIYRKAISKEEAINMILNGECGKFNPQLIEVLKNIKDKL